MIDYVVRFGDRVRNYFSSRGKGRVEDDFDRPLELSDICRLSRLVEKARRESLRPRIPYSVRENEND